jgi:hypothetical protein
MDAIGGTHPSSLQVAEPEEKTFVPTPVRIEVCNPAPRGSIGPEISGSEAVLIPVP